jgi:molybdopterin molybdotransferase
MLSVAEALKQITEWSARLEVMDLLIVDAHGSRLAGDVVSTIDSPPFDKSLMDGFALRSADAVGRSELDVVATLFAGETSSVEVRAGQSIQIMTGAPLPPGADCVIKKESVEFDEAAKRIRLKATPRVGENIIRRGASMRTGDEVLERAARLNAASIGLLAELGHARVSVIRRPEVAILATGDELVPIEATPGPGQIRNSNESMLCACVTNSGAIARPLGVCPDRADALDRLVAEGLKSDILCLSGGVSAGDKDLVPAALQRAGVEQVFHQVNLKPGKPLWFGKHARGLVFGLPGNPVSSLVCFELFVRHAIERMQGAPLNWRLPLPVRLAAQVKLQGERPVYHPARQVRTAVEPLELPQVEILNWQGSSDLCGVAAAEGIVHVPAGEGIWPAGTLVEFLPFAGPA